MLRHRTYEVITAGLKKMVDELTAYRNEQTAKANQARHQAEATLRAADAADAEAIRAQSTAEKLSALLA
jgi:hypothetical protein